MSFTKAYSEEFFLNKDNKETDITDKFEYYLPKNGHERIDDVIKNFKPTPYKSILKLAATKESFFIWKRIVISNPENVDISALIIPHNQQNLQHIYIVYNSALLESFEINQFKKDNYWKNHFFNVMKHDSITLYILTNFHSNSMYTIQSSSNYMSYIRKGNLYYGFVISYLFSLSVFCLILFIFLKKNILFYLFLQSFIIMFFRLSYSSNDFYVFNLFSESIILRKVFDLLFYFSSIMILRYLNEKTSKINFPFIFIIYILHCALYLIFDYEIFLTGIFLSFIIFYTYFYYNKNKEYFLFLTYLIVDFSQELFLFFNQKYVDDSKLYIVNNYALLFTIMKMVFISLLIAFTADKINKDKNNFEIKLIEKKKKSKALHFSILNREAILFKHQFNSDIITYNLNNIICILNKSEPRLAKKSLYHITEIYRDILLFAKKDVFIIQDELNLIDKIVYLEKNILQRDIIFETKIEKNYLKHESFPLLFVNFFEQILRITFLDNLAKIYIKIFSTREFNNTRGSITFSCKIQSKQAIDFSQDQTINELLFVSQKRIELIKAYNLAFKHTAEENFLEICYESDL